MLKPNRLVTILFLLILAALLPATGNPFFNASAAPLAVAPTLGAAASFGVLGFSTVTNTGPTVINGDLGVSPGTAVTGFPPGVVVAPGAIHAADALAAQAQSDVTTAYNALTSQACDVNLTGQDLGGLILTSGVYCFSSSAQLTGQLTLDVQGDPNAVFIFKMGSTLTTASGSSVVFSNGGPSCNVFWQVGSSATFGTASAFAGNVVALASATLTTGVSVTGSVLARNGAVTLDTNTIARCGAAPAALDLTGTVFDDANGSQVQNGAEVGTNAGGLYVNLLDGSNNVVATTTVDANGLYTFTTVVAPTLGAAASFGVLGFSTVTNTGPTVINGDLGVSPGTAVTGFPPGVVVAPGAIHAADALAAQAQSDVTTAYNALTSQACDVNLTGQDLGGLILTSGVYCFSSSAQLTGQLTLDVQGDPNAVFIFKMGSTLTTASGSSVVFSNGGPSCNVFWQVGSSATFGTASAFAGNVVALASATLTTGVSVTGSVLARNGAVTLDTNTIARCGAAPALNPNTNYTLQLTTNAGIPGQPAPAVALPSGWVTTGENNNDTLDGTPNSLLPVSVVTSNIVEQNFGIQQPPATNTPNSGAISDFVWYDTDKDGVQDVGEPGIPNVTLDLYKDTDGTPGLNTATDTKVDSTVTDAGGGYLFTGLEAGSYFVDITGIGSKLTGLTHIIANQSKSDPTAAIVLPVGGIYKDADFGYVWQSVKVVVGDTVWFDDNVDRVQQPSEPGIPNVTVRVYDSIGTVIGTADTDANGHYRIEVSPGNGYTVSPDPADIPTGLTATTPVTHSLPVLKSGDQYLDADFGYDGPGLGTIGNLVFGDNNKNGVFDGSPEAGLPGVSVSLIRDTNRNQAWNSGEPVIATVTTDKDGGYLFTGLPAGHYLVHVSNTNAVLLNYTKSVLGTAGADNHNQADPYAIDLIDLVAGGSNLTADFGYVKIDPSLGQIGNRVWIESDGNGLFNPTGKDVGQPGVTVVLYRNLNRNLYRNGSAYATTTTGASGDYLFAKLPSGTYTVTVSDSFNVLSDWIVRTLGPNPGSDDNNQLQPYQIVLPTGGENMTAGFGYIKPPADYSLTKTTITPSPVRLGTTISFSIRITNTGSTYLKTLPLIDTYDKAYISYVSSVPASVDNANDGTINWTDLLSGGSLAPGASVQVLTTFTSVKDTGTLPTVNTATVSGATSDPDGPGVAPTSPTPLPDQSSQDMVEIMNPTATLLASSQVALGDNGALLSWETVSESNVAGFHLLRVNPDGSTVRLTSLPLPAQYPGQSWGADYSWVDSSVEAGQSYTYLLEVIGPDTTTQQVEIGKLLGGMRIFLPLAIR